jgi:UDP-N-acetylglucosamine 2-epimerase
MKIITVVGARPQFIKSAPVSKAITNAGYDEYIVHTGQHYDYGMSKVFFEEMGIREPFINLNVGSGSHAQQTSQMLVGIESVLLSEKPDIVLVYGDTNSTLAGALAAVKLHIKVAHVEAGLRSYNRQMPEEHNRVLTDHCSDLLFCPTQTAVDNLEHEGIRSGVYLVGDTMYDAVLLFSKIASQQSRLLDLLGLRPKGYLLATIHRPYNTDNPFVLESILTAFQRVEETIIFPIHPRTLYAIKASNIIIPPNVHVIDPVGYMDMLKLEQNARIILTDSGGIQKEAYFFKVQCLTLRPETEWVETTASGWNNLVGTDPTRIISALKTALPPDLAHPDYFGDGHASEKIVSIFIS